jgi:hypothetical protein
LVADPQEPRKDSSSVQKKMVKNRASEYRGHSKVAQKLPEPQEEQEPAVVAAAEDSKAQLAAR